MKDTTMYYVDAVDRHIEISFSARREEHRGDRINRQADTVLRALVPGETEEESDEESNEDHEARMESRQMQFTRLTWPLRDLNVFARISLPQLDRAAGGESISFPGNFSFATDEMHANEKQMYDWLDAVQTHNVRRRQRAAASLDSDTAPKSLPLVSLPAEMVQ